MENSNSNMELVNKNYWMVQKNKITEFLVSNGCSRTIATYKATECIEKKITYSDFLEKQGDKLRFENNSIRAKEEENVEVVIKNNIKQKTIDKTVVKKAFSAVLIVTFSAIIFQTSMGVIKNYNNNEEFGKLAVNIASTEIEQMQDIDLLQDSKLDAINEMATNIVNRNKTISFAKSDQGSVTLNRDGVVNDILSVCGNRPEFFDGVMFNVFENLADAELENENPSKEVRVSNQYNHMDRIINIMKPVADKYGYDEVYKKLNNCNTFADYMFSVVTSKDTDAYNLYGETVTEYNKLSEAGFFDYAYSHMKDTASINKLMKEYRVIMNKEVANELDDLLDYYNQIESNSKGIGK